MSTKTNELYLPGFDIRVFPLLAGLPTKVNRSHLPNVVSLTGVTLGLLALAKGDTPDSGERERPHSRGRLKPMLVLPHSCGRLKPMLVLP